MLCAGGAKNAKQPEFYVELYYCTLISPRFNNSRIFAEVLKAGTDLGAQLCTKECMGKLSAEHYYNTICANLQTAHFVEIQTLLLLDAFYEFSRCDTCNFLNLVNYKDDTLPDCVSLPNILFNDSRFPE